jgi:outer membrane lipoprotein-sorting protein
MKKYYLVILIIFSISEASAITKNNIIQNLKNIKNYTFNFEQNINGKIENGICTIQYDKKIFCEYNLTNQKILVSNGKSLVIKTVNSYYLYPIEKTPLNFILNKKFLLNKINDLEERIIDKKFINYRFIENENEINIFFDKKNFNLVGWQTLDIYQNLSITFLSSIIKNQKLKKNLFHLPKQN